MLPPQLNDYSDAWSGFGEPALWTNPHAGENRGQIRLLIYNGLYHESLAIIRIDRSRRGHAIGHFVRGEHTYGDRWKVTDRHQFTVSAAQLSHLDQITAQSGLWQTYPEHWVPRDSDAICVDGVEVILERINPDGYRFSEANIQCAVSRGFLAVAEELVAIAGTPDMRAWFY